MTFWLLLLSRQQVISLSQSSCVSPLFPVSKLSLFLCLPVCHRSNLLTGDGGTGGRRIQNHRTRESLVLYKYSILSGEGESSRPRLLRRCSSHVMRAASFFWSMLRMSCLPFYVNSWRLANSWKSYLLSFYSFVSSDFWGCRSNVSIFVGGPTCLAVTRCLYRTRLRCTGKQFKKNYWQFSSSFQCCESGSGSLWSICFWPPGSGSVSQSSEVRIRIRSFCHQEKTLNPTVLWLLYDFFIFEKWCKFTLQT